MAGAAAAPVLFPSETSHGTAALLREDAEVLPPPAERVDGSAPAVGVVAVDAGSNAEAGAVAIHTRAALQTSAAAMAAADVDAVVQRQAAPPAMAADQFLSMSSPGEVVQAAPAVPAQSKLVPADAASGATDPLRRRIIQRPSTCASEPDTTRAVPAVVSARSDIAALTLALVTDSLHIPVSHDRSDHTVGRVMCRPTSVLISCAVPKIQVVQCCMCCVRDTRLRKADPAAPTPSASLFGGRSGAPRASQSQPLA